MPMFKIVNDKLVKVDEKPFDLERNLQRLTENSLEEVFGYEFVCGALNKQLRVQNFELDTLAFDPEAKAFVIIEYKKDKSSSVVDQGYNYLGLMLNNKAEFILEYNERGNANLKRGDVDWSQSKVLFVAPSFSLHQKGAIAFKGLPIELWEVTLFNDNLILYNSVKPPEISEPIEKITKNKDVERVSREIKQYTLEDHIKPGWSKAKELFDEFSQHVLELDPKFEIKPVKYYIGFNIGNKNVIAIHVRKSKLVLQLLRVKPDDLKDPEKRTRYEKNSFEYYNKHITQLDINSEDDIDYAMSLVKQVYKIFSE